jgi:hypothetical protein
MTTVSSTCWRGALLILLSPSIGNNNQLSDSIGQCFDLFFGAWIEVFGDRNRLIDNFVTNEEGGDIPLLSLLIRGNYNLVRRNRIMSNGNRGFPAVSINGIAVTGTKNDLRHNTALENRPFDLIDTNGDCAHNAGSSTLS